MQHPSHRRVEALKQQLCAASSAPLPSLSAFPFVLAGVRTRFADVDRYGHVNNSQYYFYFDSVINEFLVREGGLKPDSDEVIGVCAETQARFVSSVGFPARVHVGLRVASIGKRSVQYEVALFKDREGTNSDDKPTDASTQLCSLGTHAEVWVTRSDMRPTDIPQRIRAALEALKSKGSATSAALEYCGSTTTSASSRSSGSVQQSATRLLMVSPLHFRRNDESAADNAFMQEASFSNTEVQRRAQAEFDAYVRLLRSRGIGVDVRLPASDVFTPDGVFPNNWFSTHASESAAGVNGGRKERLLVLYPMRHRTRQRERDPNIIASLASQYDKVIDFTEEELVNEGKTSMLEGTGAAIFDHSNRVLYHAISERSTPSLAQKVAATIWPTTSSSPCSPAAPKVVSFHTRDPVAGTPLYHTNVMLGLGAHWAVVCMECLPVEEERKQLRTSLEATGHEIVEINWKQVGEFCGNVLEVRSSEEQGGKRFVAMSTRAYEAFTPEQRATLERLSGELLHTPLPTIEHVGGGGARCMIAELY